MSAESRARFAEEARSERPDLALLCLLLAAEADPELDERTVDWAQIELDRLAGMLPYGLRGGKAWASAVTELLGGRMGFHGTPADYDRLSSSLLHEVLRRRRGLPILLSVVWLEVARRAGAPVYGLGLPGHFVVGFGDPDEGLVVDPFAGGASLGAGRRSRRRSRGRGPDAGHRAADPEQHQGVGLGSAGALGGGLVGAGAVAAAALTSGVVAVRAGEAAGGAGSSLSAPPRWSPTRRWSTRSIRPPRRGSAARPCPPGRC